MTDVDSVIKRKSYPQKIHLCFENALGKLFHVLKISGIYKRSLMCYCIDFRLVVRN